MKTIKFEDEFTGDNYVLETEEDVRAMRESFDPSAVGIFDEMISLYQQIQELSDKLRHYEVMTDITFTFER